jgi:hypothetical protein
VLKYYGYCGVFSRVEALYLRLLNPRTSSGLLADINPAGAQIIFWQVKLQQRRGGKRIPLRPPLQPSRRECIRREAVHHCARAHSSFPRSAFIRRFVSSVGQTQEACSVGSRTQGCFEHCLFLQTKDFLEVCELSDTLVC